MPAPLSYALNPLTAQECRQLEVFVRKVDDLASGPFAQTETTLKAEPIAGGTHLGGQAWNLRLEGPDRYAVKAALMDFRLLYNGKEPVSAPCVVTLLKEKARERGTDAGRALIAELERYEKALEKRKKEDPYGAMFEEQADGTSTTPTPHELLRRFMYGEHLHFELSKADELGEPGHASATMVELAVHHLMRDYLAYWQRLRRLAVAVRSNRELCPAD